MAAAAPKHPTKSELQVLWEHTAAQFHEKTGKTLISEGSHLTSDDIIREIEARNMDVDPREANKKKEKIKLIGQRVLKCIQLLGGIVAQGASVMWSPAEQCFNAVSFLIAIPGKVSKIYEMIGNLFDKISVCLSQFKIYERIEQYQRIDQTLLLTISKILVSFVTICALSIELLGGREFRIIWQKIKVSLFDEDLGISAELSNLLLLAQTQSAIEGSLTLESVLNNEKKLTELLAYFPRVDQKLDIIRDSVIDLAASEKARSKEDNSMRELLKIEKKLGLYRIEDTSFKIQEENLNERVKETGEWLDNVSEYRDWEDRDLPTATPVLFLIGEENFGKSILTSAVVSKLQKKYGQGEKASTRTYVAYHYFPKGGKTNPKVLRVEYALKWMSYQLAREDKVYQKEIASVCESKSLDIDCLDLWDTLQFESSRTDVTYFLIFDGIDQVMKKYAKQLFQILSKLRNAKESGQSRLRIMLTGRNTVFGDESLELASTIRLEDHNTPDIRKYIIQALDNMEELQGDDDKRAALRSDIQVKLPHKVGGDFSKVKTAFDDFKQAKYIEGMSKILDGDVFDSETFFKKGIQKYNEKMSSGDIEDLNELLAWVVYGATYLSVAQLKAALFLRHDQTLTRSLEKTLKEYSIFFTIDSEGYVAHIPECTEIVTTEDNDDDEEDKSDAKSKQEAETPITAAEIRMVKNFILTFCGKDIFDKFGFENFFSRKGSDRAKIGMSQGQAHMIMAKSCLKLLTGNYDKDTKSLATYAVSYLPYHLNQAAKGKTIDPADKEFIQVKLLTFLTDESVIEGSWNFSSDNGSSHILKLWVDDLGSIWHWIKDFDKFRRLYSSKDDWFRTARWDEEPGMRLLQPVVRMMAKRWLRSRDFSIKDSLPWVNEYLKKPLTKASSDSESEDSESDDSESDDSESDGSESDGSASGNGRISEEDISAAISWTKEALDVKEPDSLWYERIGATYLEYDHDALAVDPFIEAKSKDQSNWRADEGRALTLAKHENLADHYLAVTEVMEMVLGVFRNNSDLREAQPHRFVQNLQHQAVWQSELKNPEEAINLYQEAVRVDKCAYKSIYGLMRVLQSLEKIEEAQELLNDRTRLVAMHQYFALDEDSEAYFSSVFVIAQQGLDFGGIRSSMQSAVDNAKEKKDKYLEGALLFYLGSAFAREQKYVDAVNQWQDCFTLTPKSGSSKQIKAVCKAFRQLSLYHYKNALKEKQEEGDPTIDLNELIKLTESASVETQSYKWRETSSTSRLLLGRYYALTGDLERARFYLKKEVQCGLDLLCDEDPSNDWQGYLMLAEILMHFGDDLNALSAYSLLAPRDLTTSSVDAKIEDKPNEGGFNRKKNGDCESKEEVGNGIKPDSERPQAELAKREATEAANPENEISETEESGEAHAKANNEEAKSDESKLEVAPNEGKSANNLIIGGLRTEIPPKTIPDRLGDFQNNCDGSCNTTWSYVSDMYCCKYCHDVQFDKGCLDKLKAGTLDRFVCGADHEFLHVPRWSNEDISKVGLGKIKVGGKIVDGVRVGGEVVGIYQWLDGLREEWGIPKPKETKVSTEE